MRCIDLFRQGMDTLAISEHLGGIVKGWTEARVYNAIRRERRDELAAAQPLIRYAGHDRSSLPWGGR